MALTPQPDNAAAIATSSRAAILRNGIDFPLVSVRQHFVARCALWVHPEWLPAEPRPAAEVPTPAAEAPGTDRTSRPATCRSPGRRTAPTLRALRCCRKSRACPAARHSAADPGT